MGKSVCSVHDCERYCFGHGYCERHYLRWRRYGDPLAGGPRKGSMIQFLEAALLTETDGCIHWPGTKCKKGYGRLTWRGRRHLAHRLICERASGPPPFPDAQAAHYVCGSSSCINKRHIRWASPAENEADKVRHGTLLKGSKCPWAKLSEAEVCEIRQSKDALHRELAARFRVSTSTISAIKRQECWSPA